MVWYISIDCQSSDLFLMSISIPLIQTEILNLLYCLQSLNFKTKINMLRERRKENEKKVKKSTYIMHACTLHIHDVERLLSQFDTQSPQYRTEFLMLHPILINSIFL